MKNIWHYNFPVGRLWIAEENDAITYIEFNKDENVLVDYNFMETSLIKKASKQLKEYFNGEREIFDLPLAPQGTEFQKKVWQVLQNIPYGETRSYKEIATIVGNPKASRAVGMANNRNPIAIIIPCHRVIGHNGSLTGYAGGLSIKEYLLNLEKTKPHFFKYSKKEIDYLKMQDPQLGEVIDKIGYIHRPVIPDIYQALVNAIIGQQISTKAQTTIWKRMQDDVSPITPENIGILSLEELQAYGISWRKATYIKEMTNSILEGHLNLNKIDQMSDEEVVTYLTEIKGIGTWTAEMIMIFSMQRPDILSWGDLAIHRGLRMLYGHPEITSKLFKEYKNRYTPYNTVASLYLWKVAGGAIPELIDPATPKKKTTKKGGI